MMNKTAKKYISPVLLMLLIWGIEIYMYNLHIISFFNPLNIGTLFLVFGVIAAIFAAGVIVSTRRKNLRSRGILRKGRVLSIEEIEKASELVSKVFLWGTLINIIFSRGFPLLWLFIGDPRTYDEFGVPSLTGFLNSFFYVSIVSQAYLYFKTSNKKYLKKLLLFLLYPFLLMTRAMIFTSLFELAGLFFLVKKINLRTIVMSVVVAFAVILVFGYMGDNRYGESETIKGYGLDLVEEDYKDTMEKLPSGFIWVYLYFTASINNVVYNINTIQPSYTPYYTVRHVLPSVLSNVLFTKKDFDSNYSMEMENSGFNTFTIFSNYIKDFGVPLTIFIFFLAGLFFYQVYYNATEDRIHYLFMYPPIFMIICLSVFDDFMLSLPTIFQFVITYYYFKKKKYGIQQRIQPQESIDNR